MVTDSEEDSPSLADLMLKLLEDRGVEELTPQKSPPASVDSSNKGAMTPLVDEVDTWEDWDLIPIEKARRLPNFVPNNKSSENTTRSRPVTKFVDFDTNSFYNALPWPVLIISGMSGVLDGLLSSNPSYMHCGIDSSHEVWTVKLKQHDLQAGDSGSWVVRKSDHGLLGMVVARSAGTAYMVSFDKIRESIERSRSLAPHSVELPKFSTKRSLSQRRAQLMSDINEGLSQYHEATPPDNAMTQNNPVGLRLSSLVSPLGSALQTLQNLMSTVIGPMKDVLKPYMENPPARIPRSGGESEPLFNIANLPNSFPSLLQALDTRTILDVCRCVHPLQYVSFAVAVLFISLRLSVGPATIPVGFFYWFPLYNCVLLYLAGALIFVRNPIGRTSEESHGDYHIRLRRINAFRKHFLMWMAIYWGRCDFYAVGICLISGDELDEDLSWHMFCRARDASSPQTPTKSTVKEASRSIWKLISSDFRGFRGMFEVSYTAIAWFLYTKIFRRPNPMPSDEDEPRGPQASERARNIPYDDDGPSRSR
ncbi:hypothetical protein HER10_EVM0007901 [Colletotrichum scovillei]|uniref:uncharacterized protein n=1 Tax=Colletotrichum scovillei TaxID=1209932 RepID=UPI0015C33ABD|nr:uncharacterized protein HER10_EVM0007901 [Colletotrichum scovillei]KAF4774018.1 hypothetical protein HER10_EVM0007901 [Colletotrichum scovillei]